MADLSLTVGELAKSPAALRFIGELSLPNLKASYAFSRIQDVAQRELERIEKARLAACERHATKDDAGKPVLTDGVYQFGDPDAFQAEWTEFLKEPVTLPGCRAVRLSELDGAARVVQFGQGEREVVRGIPSEVFVGLGPLVINDLGE